MSGYEVLLDAIRTRGVLDVPGDFVEIGAFLGGGTYKLARFAPHKRVVVLDVFDPTFDLTECDSGQTMSDVYAERVNGRNQREVFDEVTAGLPNVEVLVGDSAKVELPCEQVAFAFIDGNHDAAYVRSDFEKVWAKLSPGGLVAFHDYDHDLPDVTRTIHEEVGEHADEIARAWPEHIVFFAAKRGRG
jgi:predicted O-methyltransferase YrrM